jgi:DNA-directed RNA polymerase specialized sigma24 family protein
MSVGSEKLIRLVQLCVLHGPSGPWQDLLYDLRIDIRSAFTISGCTASELDEFSDWFGGWLFAERKLQSLLRAVERKQQSGECTTSESREKYARNYLFDIIKTAKAEYYRERASKEQLVDPRDLEGDQAVSISVKDVNAPKLEAIRQALASLPESIRIPFRLKNYDALGPLTDEETQWISTQSGTTVAVVTHTIEREFDQNRDRKFPLSSEFIGDLLSIAAAADGRNTAVDQRVSRARRRVRQVLGVEQL